MVIYKIHVESITIFKPENDPPIRADSHREKAFQLAFKDMQTKGRHVHAFDLLRGVQGREDKPYTVHHIRR